MISFQTFVFQEINIKEPVQDNKANNQETLSEQTDNSNLWTEELAKEVQNIETQSQKHAAKQDSHTNTKDIPGAENVRQDVDSEEFLHVHSSDEHLKEENPKSDEKLDLSKSRDETDKQEQTTEIHNENHPSLENSQETKDDKFDAGSEAAEKLEDEKVKETKEKTQSNKKKARAKKGRAKKKLIESEEMDEWADEDDYGDVDEPYEEDMDHEDMDDEDPLEGTEDPDYNGEETDSIESWKMTEKPLEESEDFGDEEDESSKFKEQEELQEEIKQLKGKS